VHADIVVDQPHIFQSISKACALAGAHAAWNFFVDSPLNRGCTRIRVMKPDLVTISASNRKVGGGLQYFSLSDTNAAVVPCPNTVEFTVYLPLQAIGSCGPIAPQTDLPQMRTPPR
jgi:hypothetical protein